MDSQIKVSVIIPTYNRRESIMKSVESVLNQSYGNLECIIVDDCSDDGTEDIIRNIKDKRVKYIKNGSRSGAAKSRNIGCTYATGSVVAFNDSDDIWKKEKLSKQLQALCNHANYGMVYCSFQRREGDITIRMPQLQIPDRSLSGKMFDFLIQGNVIGTPTMLIKKECFMDVGGFDESLKALEDYDLALKLSRKYEIGYVGECLVEGYGVDKGVNSQHVNIVDACIKLANKYHCIGENNALFRTSVYGLALIENLEIEKQLINRIQLEMKPNEKYFELVLSMEKRKLIEAKKEQTLADMLGLADYTTLWNEFFQDMNAQNIAIYGCGIMGRALAEQVGKSDACFWGIIDRNGIGYKEFPIYDMTTIPKEIDLIIITVFSTSFRKGELAKYTSAKLVRIDEIVSQRSGK